MDQPLTAGQASASLRRAGVSLLVRGWLSANNVLLQCRDGQPATLVDTGYVTHRDQTIDLVKHALAGCELGAIVNTHLHSDHCGGNAGLQRCWPAAAITVPAGYQDAITPWDESRLSFQHTGQRCEPFKATGYLADGQERQLGGMRWQVHAAPGHDPDALVFFQPDEGILISGDALWESRLAIIFPALAGASGFDAAHVALDRIERLAPKVVLPGHGPAFTDVANAIAQSRNRLEAFASAPERHRTHAARALVAYHMLDVGVKRHRELIAWIAATPVFREALQCDDDELSALGFATDIVHSLVSAGVLRNIDGCIEMSR